MLLGVAAALSAGPASAQAAPDTAAEHQTRYVRAYVARYGGTERRSTAMMVTGIVLTGLGALTMGLGTGGYFGRSTCVEAPIALRGPPGGGAGAGSGCPP